MLPLPQLKSRSGGLGEPMLTRSLSAYTAPSLEIGSSFTLPAEDDLLKSLTARFWTRFCASSTRTHAWRVFPPPLALPGPEVPQAASSGADRPAIVAADRKVRRERGCSPIRTSLVGGGEDGLGQEADRFSKTIDTYICRSLEKGVPPGNPLRGYSPIAPVVARLGDLETLRYCSRSLA